MLILSLSHCHAASLEIYPSCDDTTISLQEITNSSDRELEEEFWIDQLPNK